MAAMLLGEWHPDRVEARVHGKYLFAAAAAPSADDGRRDEGPDGDLDFRTFIVAGVPAALMYTEVQIAPDRVTASTSDAGPRPVTCCADAYTVLRASAQAHLSAADLQAMPAEATT